MAIQYIYMCISEQKRKRLSFTLGLLDTCVAFFSASAGEIMRDVNFKVEPGLWL